MQSERQHLANSLDRSGLVLRGRSFWAVVAFAPAILFLASVAAWNLVRDIDRMTTHGAEVRAIVATYERRLHSLRQEVERVSSREAVARARLARKAEQLSHRFSWLEANAATLPSGADSVVGLRLRSPHSGEASSDVLVAVEDSLRRAERRQLGDIERLGSTLVRKTRRLAKVLKLHGITARTEATGGPLIALKGSADFDGRVAAFEAAQAAYDSIRRRADQLPQGSPVPGRKISSHFGARRDPLNGRQAMHGGLDFRAPKGHPVRSTASGTVKFAGRRGGYGKLVEIDHGNGLTTRYGHLSRVSVSKGDRVERGAMIGRVGSTGRSTGPHLHYEVRRRGQVRDPAHYVRLGRRLKPLL